MSAQFYYVGWRGFEKARTIGKMILMEWPKKHPDTHCQAHTYTPDEKGVCVCGWIPADAIHCEGCKTTLRQRVEKSLLRRMVKESAYSRQEDLIMAAYLGYVEAFGEHLKSTPDLLVVATWFNKLGDNDQRAVLKKHYPKPDVTITFTALPSLGVIPSSTKELLKMIAESVFGTFSNEQLKDMLESPDLPEDIAASIRQILKDREGGEEEQAEES